MRPGEYAILDTQDLDVFAMEPVTCRWVRAQLTVIQDLFTRCITGLRVAKPVQPQARCDHGRRDASTAAPGKLHRCVVGEFLRAPACESDCSKLLT